MFIEGRRYTLDEVGNMMVRSNLTYPDREGCLWQSVKIENSFEPVDVANLVSQLGELLASAQGQEPRGARDG